MYNDTPAGHESLMTQMHFRKSAQAGSTRCQGHSGQGLETIESVADQKIDGNVLDTYRWKKKSNSGGFVFVACGRAPERNRTQALKLLQIRIRSAIRGTALSLLYEARRGACNSETRIDVRRICRLDSIQQRHVVHSSPAPLSMWDWVRPIPMEMSPADFIGKFERLDEDWA